MKQPTNITPRVAELADRLVADIAERQLKPGDRYLTTADASRFLGVSNGPANLALQLLERRQVISRQQRRGAFIRELPAEGRRPLLHRVHFLVHPMFFRTEGVGNDHMLLGIQRELPGVHAQISFLPTTEETNFVQQLIGQALGSDSTDGFILVRASCDTQRLVAGCGLPAVVYGSVYPGVGKLACLDRDMEGIGTQIVGYMLSQGHKRFAYLNRQLTYPGDHRTMDAIAAKLTEAGGATGDLVVRCLPPNSEVSVAEIESVLQRPHRPTGLICRTGRIAEAATVAIERLRLNKDNFDIVVCDYYLSHRDRPQFAYARPMESDEDQGRQLAKLLVQQVHGKPSNCEPVIVPVELEFPSSD